MFKILFIIISLALSSTAFAFGGEFFILNKTKDCEMKMTEGTVKSDQRVLPKWKSGMVGGDTTVRIDPEKNGVLKYYAEGYWTHLTLSFSYHIVDKSGQDHGTVTGYWHTSGIMDTKNDASDVVLFYHDIASGRFTLVCKPSKTNGASDDS